MSLDSWEIRMCIPAKRGHPINKAGGCILFGFILYHDPDSLQRQFRFDLIVESFVVFKDCIHDISLIP